MADEIAAEVRARQDDAERARRPRPASTTEPSRHAVARIVWGAFHRARLRRLRARRMGG
jgi:hypothetical protein